MSGALQGEAVAAACRALEGWVTACATQRAYGDYVLLRELLAAFATRYAEAKHARSGLDFEDLELLACRLLEENEALRERYRERFVHLLVDEFQDTNRLQIRLLRLLAGDDGRLFTVGDEFQSIYGFRHADVGVFREFRSAAAEHDRVRPLTENFRSRPEILETLNAVFGPHWADEFQPLRPGGDGHAASPDDQLQLDLNGSTPARGGTAVELIVTDLHAHRWKPLGDAPFGESLAVPPAWRAAEMRLLADRIRKLVDEGRDPAEIVGPAARGRRHAPVRAGAARAGHRDLRGRRAQLLGAAAGRRPARLPGGARKPARPGRALHDARLAPRWAVSRRTRSPRSSGAQAEARPVVGALRGGRLGWTARDAPGR